MEKRPVVSIIVPVYNIEHCISECLISISKQSYKNFEVLVIDDGSTDMSGKICDEFSSIDARFKIIHQKNGGLSNARNTGINKAQGEFLCFVDGDDCIQKDFVQKMYKTALHNGGEIVVCGYKEKEINKEKLVLPKPEILTGKEATIRLLLRQENIEIIAWNKLYRSELFKKSKIRFPEGFKYEDNLTTYKVLSLAKKVIYIPEALYIYNRREGSITKCDKKEEKLKARELAAKDAEEFFKKDKEFLAASKISLLLAKYAFLDFSIRGDIDAKYQKDTLKWLKKNAKLYNNNMFMTLKLRFYNILSTKYDGIFYKIFRKVKHE